MNEPEQSAENERRPTPFQEMTRHLSEDHRVGGLTHVRGLTRLTDMHYRLHKETGERHDYHPWRLTHIDGSESG